MLEFELQKGKEIIKEGTIGNQFKFMELVDALGLVYEAVPKKYPTLYKYFPRSNDGHVPADRVAAFHAELTAAGQELIPVKQLVWKYEKDRSITQLEDKLYFKEVAAGVYEVLNRNGYQLVMGKEAYKALFRRSIADKDLVPFEKIGQNWDSFNGINLKDPVIAFQSFDFQIRSFGHLHLLMDNENISNKFVLANRSYNNVLKEEVKVENQQRPFGRYNYIYDSLVEAALSAVNNNAQLNWG